MFNSALMWPWRWFEIRGACLFTEKPTCFTIRSSTNDIFSQALPPRISLSMMLISFFCSSTSSHTPPSYSGRLCVEGEYSDLLLYAGGAFSMQRARASASLCTLALLHP